MNFFKRLSLFAVLAALAPYGHAQTVTNQTIWNANCTASTQIPFLDTSAVPFLNCSSAFNFTTGTNTLQVTSGAGNGTVQTAILNVNPSSGTLISANIVDNLNNRPIAIAAGAQHSGSASGVAACIPLFGSATGVYYESVVTVGNVGDFGYCSGQGNPAFFFKGANTGATSLNALLLQDDASGGGEFATMASAATTCNFTTQPTLSGGCTFISGDVAGVGKNFMLLDGFGTIAYLINNNLIDSYIGDTTPVKWLHTTSTGTSVATVLIGDTNTGSTTKMQGGASSETIANGGITMGAPTGGAQGANTLNATGLFVNGVAVSVSTLAETTGSTTPNLAGCTTVPTPAVHWTQIGHHVIVRIAAVACTSNSTGLGLASGAVPSPTVAATNIPVAVMEDAGALVGNGSTWVRVTTAGAIDFCKATSCSAGGSGWTNSATSKGIGDGSTNGIEFSYMTN